jgi:hypothetical protein
MRNQAHLEASAAPPPGHDGNFPALQILHRISKKRGCGGGPRARPPSRALFALRSRGPIAVSAATMTSFGCLGLSASTGAGSAVISTACPSISLDYSLVGAPRDPLLKMRDHGLKLLVA